MPRVGFPGQKDRIVRGTIVYETSQNRLQVVIVFPVRARPPLIDGVLDIFKNPTSSDPEIADSGIDSGSVVVDKQVA